MKSTQIKVHAIEMDMNLKMDDILKVLGEIKIIRDFEKVHNINGMYLPKILVTDPLSKKLNFSHGDVVCIQEKYYYVF